MSVNIRLAAAIIALIAPVLTHGLPARAQTQQQLDWCTGKDIVPPDQVIGGCTALIQSGKFTGKNLAAAFTNRGIAYANKDQTDRAIQDHDQAIKLDPNDARALNIRGNAYLSNGQADRAIQDHDQAIRLNLNNVLVIDSRSRAVARKLNPNIGR